MAKTLNGAMNKRSFSKVGNVANWGFGALGGMMEYNDARLEGKGVARAAAEATFTTALWSTIGIVPAIGLAVGGMAYQGGKQLVAEGINNSRNYQRTGMSTPFANATFVDSQQAYTMRQAGVTQIQNNMMNTKKAVMGNEAMHMHR